MDLIDAFIRKVRQENLPNGLISPESFVDTVVPKLSRNTRKCTSFLYREKD